LLAQRFRQRPDADASEAFLEEIIWNLFDAPPSDVARQSSSRRRSLVDRARRRLAQAPGSPHPLPELAEWLGVSAFHFARVFRAETGLSVHQYLLRLRMAGALRRLSCYKTDLSRLALELGFSSHSHFTATFRKEFGVNPAHVRSMLDRDRRCAGTRYLPWPVNRHADGAHQNHSA
jgi:AraC-like DNA-binding protein